MVGCRRRRGGGRCGTHHRPPQHHQTPRQPPAPVRHQLRATTGTRRSYTRTGDGRSPNRSRRATAQHLLHRPRPDRPNPRRNQSRRPTFAMTAQFDRITAARQALAELGVTIAELHDTDHVPRVPTLGEYLPIVIAAADPGANRTYGTYWARMATATASAARAVRSASAAPSAIPTCTGAGAGASPTKTTCPPSAVNPRTAVSLSSGSKPARTSVMPTRSATQRDAIGCRRQAGPRWRRSRPPPPQPLRRGHSSPAMPSTPI